MTDDNMMKAYEADKKLRAGKDEELRAAKDYLAVVLKDVEEKNHELESVKSEIDSLRGEVNKLKDDSIQIKSNERSERKGRVLFICISIAEAVAIVVLSIFFLLEKNNTANEVKSTDDLPPISMVTPLPMQLSTEATEAERGNRYNDDLDSFVKMLAKNSAGRFTEEVTTLGGEEYLMLTGAKCKVYYRNQYQSSDDPFRKCIVVEASGKRVELAFSYDLNDAEHFFEPYELRMTDGALYLAFFSSDPALPGGMPASLALVNEATLAVSEINDFEQFVKEALNFTMDTDDISDSTDAIKAHISIPGINVNYSIPTDLYTDITYREIELPVISFGYDFDYSDKRAEFKCDIRLDEDSLLGRATYTFGIKSGKPFCKVISLEVCEDFVQRRAGKEAAGD